MGDHAGDRLLSRYPENLALLAGASSLARPGGNLKNNYTKTKGQKLLG